MADTLKIKTEENSRISWIAAIDAWDYCDPKPLGEMISNHGVPDELRPIIAAIISGDRVPNKKAAAKSKIDADQRMIIAEVYLSIMEIPKAALGKSLASLREQASENHNVDLDVFRSRLQQSKKRYRGLMLEHIGVSERTLENLVSQFNEKIKNYPKI